MEESTGIIKSTKNGGSEGVITEHGSEANLEFINPRIPNPPVGDRYSFLKIIQNTPNGSTVVNILKGKLP